MGGLLIFLVGLTIVLILLSAVVAPLESLGWYAGWFGDKEEQEKEAMLVAASKGVSEQPAKHYLVYLSGIGAIDPSTVPDEEYPFLEGLRRRLPDTRVVDGIFPYSVSNIGMTNQRLFARIWNFVLNLHPSNPFAALAFLINLRNMFQVAVSADLRYGPIFNSGTAQEITEALLKAGYRPGSGTPVTLFGWSGGGQISVGAVTHLKRLLGNRTAIYVISLGGVLSDDHGIRRVEHLTHLYGTKDPVQNLGAILYAGRWSVMQQSVWNQAVREGKITLTALGPYAHNITQHYFDRENSLSDDGRTCMQVSLDAVQAVLMDWGVDRGVPLPIENDPAVKHPDETEVPGKPRLLNEETVDAAAPKPSAGVPAA